MNTIYRVSAFAEDINGGNLAGVVFNADNFSDRQMLEIAKEVGYSETAFVMKSNIADFKIRFFTPVDEVDLCGHATVATFNLLRELGIINLGSYKQETKAGVLDIEVYKDFIFMEQKKPQFYNILKKEEIEKCFANTNYIDELPIQIVSTGIKDLFLPVKTLDKLLELKPNVELITDLSIKYDVVGIHAFCFETLNKSDAHVRNFAPRYGIIEESATGTSNGALACYLMKNMAGKFKDDFIFEQGYVMNKPSMIKVKLNCENTNITKVRVGGKAIIVK